MGDWIIRHFAAGALAIVPPAMISALGQRLAAVVHTAGDIVRPAHDAADHLYAPSKARKAPGTSSF
ncbi:MAG: hypothetical protein ACKVKH_18975 [Verrucomicrobiales bacterium]